MTSPSPSPDDNDDGAAGGRGSDSREPEDNQDEEEKDKNQDPKNDDEKLGMTKYVVLVYGKLMDYMIIQRRSETFEAPQKNIFTKIFWLLVY